MEIKGEHEWNHRAHPGAATVLPAFVNDLIDKISEPRETVGSALTGAQNHDVRRYGVIRFLQEGD